MTSSAFLQRPRRLQLSNDVVFKALFCGHPHLLSDLIDAVRHPATPTSIVRILNSDIPPEAPQGKAISVDILAQDADGRYYVLEMQRFGQCHWPARNMYYLARNLVRQLRRGNDYDSLQPVIGISLLGQNLYPKLSDQADWRFAMRDGCRPAIEFDDRLQLHIVELDKAESLPSPALRAWASCLRDSNNEALMSQITHPPVLEALQLLEDMQADDVLAYTALSHEIALMDQRVAFRHARKEGRAEGREEGREEGLEEGRAKGQAMGRISLLERQIAHRFGAVPPDVLARLREADATQVESWALQLLDAPSLDAVFR